MRIHDGSNKAYIFIALHLKELSISFRTERVAFDKNKSFLNHKSKLKTYLFINVLQKKFNLEKWDKKTNKPTISYYSI